mmetsp:Transcript_545/g.1384  ORF Transcript_545/g.1384 Transcript_545/m.1384 type:complete len:224 (-) Transcript_545:113-784(-)|eukprot:CAMPEP_0171501768 /NCGR_PEP_ID=MMETSP0958-20121227/9752_1 /TAXON_ID=87120 /ORGANISM="Aurantiochytrium limacinum, Strain ATCCMYA-1381" /LENGTH=223 /DNA_ID=CAMNT_0012036641 /DNA_START=51 /DNA_END=722 /DNA_ORIENTATION=+
MFQAFQTIERKSGPPARSALNIRVEREHEAQQAGSEESGLPASGLYADCFTIKVKVTPDVLESVPHTAVHTEYIRSFFSSWVFTPERNLLGLVRKVTGFDIPEATVESIQECDFEDFPEDRETYDFDHDGVCMFRLMERTDSPKACESLFEWNPRGVGLTWFASVKENDGYQLYYGSAIDGTDRLGMGLLKQFHIFYARLLLAGAVTALENRYPGQVAIDKSS